MSLFLCYVLRRSVSAVWSESLKVAMHQIHQCVVIKSCLINRLYIHTQAFVDYIGNKSSSILSATT